MTVTLIGQHGREFIKVDVSEATEEKFRKARVAIGTSVQGLLGKIAQTVPAGEDMTEEHVVSFLKRLKKAPH